MNLGVCYYPEHTHPSNWEDDANAMRELGIRFVRIAEFCWSRIEPCRNEFNFEWLDKAIAVLGKNGLDIVMCTPTATPPKWLVDQNPSILAVDENGKIRGFGSRRHYSFSSEIYRHEAKRITEIFAKKYAGNPYIVGWQTDNEYGCHNTTMCYSQEALNAFRHWLQKKYTDITHLNEAWGNVFWSMEYGDFSEIELPNLAVTETNPSQRLDFYRFSSDQVVKFNRLQTDILRKCSPNTWITHNSMGMFFDYDHFDLCQDLDFISWDNYPLGFLASGESFDPEDKRTYFRTGHPDLSPFMHDLFRSQSKEKKFWIMEQQPGPVNWAPYNPIPEKGIVRQWILQGFAHGAETVSCFRWRQCPFAQEQEHAGLKYSDNEFTPFSKEVSTVSAEITELKKHHKKKSTPAIGLVFDYESIHRIKIQPQGKDFDPVKLYIHFYSAARSLGLNVEMLPVSANFEAYDLLLIPCLPYGSEEFAQKIANHPGLVVLGPRSFSKTINFQIPTNPALDYLDTFFGNKLSFVDSFPASIKENVIDTKHNKTWEFSRWKESFRKQTEANLLFSDGSPACLQKNNLIYLAFFPEVDFLVDFLQSKLPPALSRISEPLTTGIRKTFLDNFIFYFNTAADNYNVPVKNGQKILLGNQVLERNQVTVLADMT